jgi:ABC-2 type transport system permease protein
VTAPSLARSGSVISGFAATTLAFAQRGIVRMTRVPSIIAPMIVMPVFFLVAFSGSFASAVQIEGYGTDKAVNWMAAWALLQGGAFSGMGAAGAAATDLENGFFDRIRLAPIPTFSVVTGLLAYAMIRAALPMTVVLAVAFGLLDADMPGGVMGVVMVYVAGLGLAVVMALIALTVVFTVKNLKALGLAQILIFASMFLSVGQAPLVAIEGWMHSVAEINPVTRVIRMCRQGFLGPVTWDVTAEGLLALAGMIAFFGLTTIWRFRQIND